MTMTTSAGLAESTDGRAARVRTYTWEDPSEAAAALPSMAGIDFLHAIGRREIPPPPMAVTLAIEPVMVERGRAVFQVAPAEWHDNPLGFVHGGLVAALVDTALGCAVQSTLGAGVGYTTADLNVHFVRPVGTDSGVITADATVLHPGRRLATAEARVTDGVGRLVAHATTTCFVFAPH
jgi:uncharacterized protein (TIGR00369 family)